MPGMLMKRNGWLRIGLGIVLAARLVSAPVLAQTLPSLPATTPSLATQPPDLAPVDAPQSTISLSAVLATSTTPIRTGLAWRLFQERADPDGNHALVAESSESTPTFQVPDGSYVVHVTYGLASAMKRVAVYGRQVSERLQLTAGALRVTSMLGDAAIPPARAVLSVYIPDRSGSEAKLVVSNAHPGDILRLPEGAYRVVSTYLDKESAGSTGAPGALPNATNSIVSADLRVQAGKLTEASLRHHAAVLTLKLVNAPGSEALANTSFSVLTPGGDVIRELVGAFPALILAEGEYVVIARRDGKTYQSTFTVQSTLDRDVEVIAK